jgi:hypothetical protein
MLKGLLTRELVTDLETQMILPEAQRLFEPLAARVSLFPRDCACIEAGNAKAEAIAQGRISRHQRIRPPFALPLHIWSRKVYTQSKPGRLLFGTSLWHSMTPAMGFNSSTVSLPRTMECTATADGVGPAVNLETVAGLLAAPCVISTSERVCDALTGFAQSSHSLRRRNGKFTPCQQLADTAEFHYAQSRTRSRKV